MNRHSRDRFIRQVEEYLAAWAELGWSTMLDQKQGRKR